VRPRALFMCVCIDGGQTEKERFTVQWFTQDGWGIQAGLHWIGFGDGHNDVHTPAAAWLKLAERMGTAEEVVGNSKSASPCILLTTCGFALSRARS
jgi:hypothetical protein